MSAIDKLNSAIGHCQSVKMTLENDTVKIRLSKIPDSKQTVDEIQYLMEKAIKLLDSLRDNYNIK